MSTYTDASLIYYPSGYKASKAYSLKPTDGSGDLTFTRASTATRVNEQGLIEGVRTNLILQSNTFDTTWTNTSTTLTSGQSGYDGTNNAWLLTKPATSFARIQQTFSSTSGLKTFSIYLKAGTLSWCRLFAASAPSPNIYVNLSNGSLGSQYDNISATSIDVGAGWYRVSLTFDASISEVRIYPADANDSVSGISGSIYIQDAQLEASVQATEYIPTTTTAVSVGMLANVPRIDYTGGGCGKLLLEPQRTNYITYSNYDASTWTQTTASISINSATSPDGTTNAHTATRTSVSTQRIGVAAFSATAGQPYTNSIYLRKVSGSGLVRLIDINNTPTTFTLTTEWVRYSVTAIAVASTQRLYVEMTEVGDVIEFWQGQIENGSYSTSLINTTSTAVTRVKDSASKSGISSLIGQTEGTLFVEFNIDGDISGNRTVITLSSGSSVDFIASFIFNNLFYARIRANNGSLIDVTKSGLTSGVHKVAIGYAANDLTFYLDGVLVGQNTSASVAFANPLSVVRIAENEAAINQLGDGINSAMLFTTRLDNATLATLTTI